MKISNFDDELFQECIEALQPQIGILSKEESDQIINLFEKKYQFMKVDRELIGLG